MSTSIFHTKILTYSEVLHAARETAERLMAARANHQQRKVTITARGGMTASVTWDAHQAEINLPSLPADTKLTRAEADRILGFLVHEISHPLHSDWNQWMTAVNAGEIIKTFTNVVEDLRIESIEIRLGKMAGYKGLIAGTTRNLHERTLVEWEEKGVVIGSPDTLIWTFAYAGRALVHNMDLDGVDQLLQALPSPVRALFDQMVAAVPTLADTDASRAVAENIVKALGQLPPMELPPGDLGKVNQTPTTQQEGEDGEGEGEGETGTQGDTEEQPEVQGKGKGKAQPEAQPEDEGQGKGEGEAQGKVQGEAGAQQQEQGQEGGNDAGQPGEEQSQEGGSGAGQPGSLLEQLTQTGAPKDDMERLIEELIERTEGLEQALKNGSKRGNIGLDHRPAQIVNHVATLASGKRKATALRQRVKGAALARDQIMTMLKSESRAGWTEHQQRGRLDPRAMARVRMGRKDVFRQRWTEEGMETAVCVLIDMSSSMAYGQRVASAMAMALTVCDAVELANGKVAVLGFGDASNWHSWTSMGCSLHVMKDWNTPKAKADAAIVAWQPVHSTPLSPAIVSAADWMRKTVQADRYVLIVMTDGGCNYGPHNTAAACNIAVHRYGVEVCAMLCETSGGEEAFKGFPCVEVADAENLGKETLRSLARQVAAQQARL